MPSYDVLLSSYSFDVSDMIHIYKMHVHKLTIYFISVLSHNVKVYTEDKTLTPSSNGAGKHSKLV